MSKHKISELEGALLDAAVAKGEGWTKDAEDSTAWWKDGKVVCISEGGAARGYGYRPSSDWAVGGPIIERERIEVYPSWEDDGHYPSWRACILKQEHTPAYWLGPTALVAAMRAYVASKFGEYVELP